ncbi:OmpA family protein [candidate division KSB1 bacterium]|nr:OmpA family protein [candidate division KSB1 bacterium]MBL7094595.1 OmpA family protein [candidate division KSB1 bacterium]
MKLKLALLLTVLLFILTSVVNSQSWDQAKGIGLTGSFIKFIGDEVDRAAIGNWSGLSLRYGVSSHVMFDLNADYGSFKPSVGGSLIKRSQKDKNAPYRTFLFPINLEMKYSPVEEGSLKPYISFGAGLVFWDLRDIGGTGMTFFGDQKLRWGKRVHGAIRKEFDLMAGLGMDIFLSNSIALDIEAGFKKTLNSDIEDNVGQDDHNNAVLTGRATLSYYFGYYKDTDKDGIEDKHDADPYHAEDYDGFQGDDGAPDDDNDGDGIPDLKDKAPNEPEDKDGFQDEDGVPDLDNDDDGCPDKKPFIEKKGAKLILKGINFASGSATLTEDSYETLDKVAAGLRDNIEVAIEIRGYTDSYGSAKANQKLSQRRAQSVMQYLINAGIDQSRLKAVGYGEKDPIATNKTKEGRAQNRRIEFIWIK